MDELRLWIMCLVLPFALIIALGFGVVFLQYKYVVNTAQANIIIVKVNNKEVYNGKSAFVDIDSAGATTTIVIYKKLFPFHVIDKVYTDKDITVVNN